MQTKFLFLDWEEVPGSQLPNCSAVVACVPNTDDRVVFERFAKLVMQSGAELIAFIGENSAEAEDSLDWFLEDAGLLNVSTTAHADESVSDVKDFVESYLSNRFDVPTIAVVGRRADPLVNELVRLID